MKKSIPDTEWRSDVTGGYVRYLNGWSLRLSPVNFAVKGASHGFKRGFRGLIDATDVPYIRGFKKDLGKIQKQLEYLARFPRTSDNLRLFAKMKTEPTFRR